MADVAQLLQTMHPMREPPPPAPIVPYLVMLAVGILGAALAFVVIRQAGHARAGLRRSAEAALAGSRQLLPAERLAAQARLLRRIVRTVAGDGAARAQDGAWLGVLDRTFATTFFASGDGRVYGDALYRRGAEADVEALDQALSGFIAALRPSRTNA